MEDFDKTLSWVTEEEKLRKERGQGISTFYLFIMSFMVIAFIVFMIYLINTNGKELEALEMMQDPDNFYDDEYSDASDYVEELPTTVEESSLPLPPLNAVEA